MPRKTYDHEFRVSAVKLVTEQGYTPQQAAESLGVTSQSIRIWMKRLRRNGSGQVIDRDEEIARLRRENAQLRMEREILKKAATFFAKENR